MHTFCVGCQLIFMSTQVNILPFFVYLTLRFLQSHSKVNIGLIDFLCVGFDGCWTMKRRASGRLLSFSDFLNSKITDYSSLVKLFGLEITDLLEFNPDLRQKLSFEPLKCRLINLSSYYQFVCPLRKGGKQGINNRARNIAKSPTISKVWIEYSQKNQRILDVLCSNRSDLY